MLGRIFSRPRKRPPASSLAASVETLEDRTLLSATGAMLGDSVIIDNGDTGFSTSGPNAWGMSMNGGFAGDHAYNASGTGLDAAQWKFNVEPGGTYQVAVTWLAGTNRASNAPFTVFDGDIELSTTIINQEVPPDDLTADGVTWESIGEFTITSDTLTVRLTDDANEFVIADAVRITQILDQPEIQVSVDGADLADGGALDLGETLVGGTLSTTVTVTNTGNEDLLLEDPVLPDGFTLSRSFSATTLAAGESTSFVIQFNGTTLGDFSGEVSFGNNDGDEGPFNFTVNATVSDVLIIDNGDAGFSTTGTWDVSNNGGFDGDHAYTDPGDGDTAEWTAQVAPGTYEVSATWLKATNRATDATYTILDGDTVVGTVVVDQELDPGSVEGGWEILGQFTITSGTLTVRLTDAADDFVIADAVSITSVPDSGGDGGTEDGKHSECVHEVVRDWQSTRPDDTLGSRLQDLVCEHNLQLEAAALPAPRGWGRWKDHPSK